MAAWWTCIKGVLLPMRPGFVCGVCSGVLPMESFGTRPCLMDNPWLPSCHWPPYVELPACCQKGNFTAETHHHRQVVILAYIRTEKHRDRETVCICGIKIKLYLQGWRNQLSVLSQSYICCSRQVLFHLFQLTCPWTSEKKPYLRMSKEHNFNSKSRS